MTEHVYIKGEKKSQGSRGCIIEDWCTIYIQKIKKQRLQIYKQK